MRDAFGGVFMIRLLLVFIVIYVAFTAVSFKYAKSFRIKNKVIDFVEQNQIIDIDNFFNQGSGKNLSDLNEILSLSKYDIACEELGHNGDGTFKDSETGLETGYCYKGIEIVKNEAKSDKNRIYYDVYTYVDWNIGALNTILMLGGKSRGSDSPIIGKWKISGEAIVINK